MMPSSSTTTFADVPAAEAAAAATTTTSTNGRHHNHNQRIMNTQQLSSSSPTKHSQQQQQLLPHNNGDNGSRRLRRTTRHYNQQQRRRGRRILLLDNKLAVVGTLLFLILIGIWIGNVRHIHQNNDITTTGAAAAAAAGQFADRTSTTFSAASMAHNFLSTTSTTSTSASSTLGSGGSSGREHFGSIQRQMMMQRHQQQQQQQQLQLQYDGPIHELFASTSSSSLTTTSNTYDTNNIDNDERPLLPVYVAIPTIPRGGDSNNGGNEIPPDYLIQVLQSLQWSQFPLSHVHVFCNDIQCSASSSSSGPKNNNNNNNGDARSGSGSGDTSNDFSKRTTKATAAAGATAATATGNTSNATTSNITTTTATPKWLKQHYHVRFEQARQLYGGGGGNGGGNGGGAHFYYNTGEDVPSEIHPSVFHPQQYPYPAIVNMTRPRFNVTKYDTPNRIMWRRKECYDFLSVINYMLDNVIPQEEVIVKLEDPASTGEYITQLRPKKSWIIWNQDDGVWRKTFYPSFYNLLMEEFYYDGNDNDDHDRNTNTHKETMKIDLHLGGLVSVALSTNLLSSRHFQEYAQIMCDFLPVDWLLWEYLDHVIHADNPKAKAKKGFVEHIGKVSTRKGRIYDDATLDLTTGNKKTHPKRTGLYKNNAKVAPAAAAKAARPFPAGKFAPAATTPGRGGAGTGGGGGTRRTGLDIDQGKELLQQNEQHQKLRGGNGKLQNLSSKYGQLKQPQL